ncbi:MAG: GAF domain-containing protein [Gemmatimonadaceae bacterium]
MPTFEPRTAETNSDTGELPGAELVRQQLAAGARRSVELQQLQQMAVALSRTMDEDTILDEVARGSVRALGGTGVIILVADEKVARLVTRRHVTTTGDRPLIPFRTDQGALAGSLLGGAPLLLTRDRAEDARAIDETIQTVAGIQALLVVPMVHGRNLIGALVAYSEDRHVFDTDSREFLTTIAISAGTALRSARLYAESERERRQSDAMAEVARAVGESLKVMEVQRLIMRHAMALLRANGASVSVRDGDYLLVEAALGIADVAAGLVIPVQGSLSGDVVRTGAALISNDVAAEQNVYRRNLQLVDVRRAVIVPLRTARGVIGALAVYNREEEFRDEDARILLRLADQVAVAIVNARLFADIQDATREWSSTFDAIGVGMAVVNDEGRVLRCNARARQLVGDGSPLGLVGRPFYQALLGMERPDGDDPLRRAIEEGVRSRSRCQRAEDIRRFEITAVAHQNGGAVVTFDEIEA